MACVQCVCVCMFTRLQYFRNILRFTKIICFMITISIHIRIRMHIHSHVIVHFTNMYKMDGGFTKPNYSYSSVCVGILFSVCYNGHITTFIIEWRMNNLNASKERAMFLFSVNFFHILYTKAQKPRLDSIMVLSLKLKSLYPDWCRL